MVDAVTGTTTLTLAHLEGGQAMSEMQWPNIGDEIRIKAPPPLTWWDRVLWRLFRIERKREPIDQVYVVTDATER